MLDIDQVILEQRGRERAEERDQDMGGGGGGWCEEENAELRVKAEPVYSGNCWERAGGNVGGVAAA